MVKYLINAFALFIIVEILLSCARRMGLTLRKKNLSSKKFFYVRNFLKMSDTVLRPCETNDAKEARGMTAAYMAVFCLAVLFNEDSLVAVFNGLNKLGGTIDSNQVATVVIIAIGFALSWLFYGAFIWAAQLPILAFMLIANASLSIFYGVKRLAMTGVYYDTPTLAEKFGGKQKSHRPRHYREGEDPEKILYMNLREAEDLSRFAEDDADVMARAEGLIK